MNQENLERWLIVGGTGLVGSFLSELLRSQGISVRTLSRRNEIDDPRHIVANVLDDGWLAVVDPTAYDNVAYLAYSSSDNQVESAEINSHQVIRLINHFSLSGLKSFIYVGSMAAFGQTFDVDLIDEDQPKNPVGVYATNKMLCTKTILKLDYGFQINVIHPTEVYSIESNRINTYRNLLRNNRIMFDLGGQGLKNIVHASDVAKAIILVGGRSSGLKNEEYIVNGETITWNRWIDLLSPNNVGIKSLPSFFSIFTRGPVRRFLNQRGFITPLQLPKYKRLMMECKSKFSSNKIHEHTGWYPSANFENVIKASGKIKL